MERIESNTEKKTASHSSGAVVRCQAPDAGLLVTKVKEDTQ
jgi:hypothetical protein